MAGLLNGVQPMPVYDLRDVSRSFGEFPALQGVTLAIRSGERVAVLGPSGAGAGLITDRN